MTPSSTAAKVVFGVAGLLLIGFDAPAALREPADGFVPAPQAIARIVYVSAIDKYGNPVTDLQQADFELKVDGKKSTIVNVRPAEAPMRIALIVSDAGTGGFQLGLATFMQTAAGTRRVFADLGDRPARDRCRVFIRSGRAQGGPASHRVRADVSAAHSSWRPSRRRRNTSSATARVPSSWSRGSAPKQPLPFQETTFANSCGRAAPSCTSCPRSARNVPPRLQHGTGISTEQAQLQDSEVADGAFNLAQVLGDGSKDSGGRHEQVIETSLVPALERMAHELLNQYAISYMLPDGARPGDKLSLSSKRKGVKLLAPSRIPP